MPLLRIHEVHRSAGRRRNLQDLQLISKHLGGQPVVILEKLKDRLNDMKRATQIVSESDRWGTVCDSISKRRGTTKRPLLQEFDVALLPEVVHCETIDSDQGLTGSSLPSASRSRRRWGGAFRHVKWVPWGASRRRLAQLQRELENRSRPMRRRII